MNTSAPLGSITNPVRCNGVQAANQYLSQLLGPEGQFLQFQRLRNVGEGVFGNIVDEYLVESITDPFEAIVYVDCYHQWREKNSPLNLLIQPPHGRKTKTQLEETHMWSELSKKFSADFNQTLPNHAVYVGSKAFRLSEIGPTLYAFHDAFNFPYDYWNLTAIMKASKQISTELRGFCSAHPLLLESKEEIEAILNTFHFDLLEISRSDLDKGLYQIKSTHAMEKYPFEWWIKVRFLDDAGGQADFRDPELDDAKEISQNANKRFILGLISKMTSVPGMALLFVLIGIAAIAFSDLIAMWTR